MNTEMFTAILDLVREGGQAAIYIVIAHYILTLLQFVIGFSLLAYLVSRIHNIIRYGIDHSKNFRHD